MTHDTDNNDDDLTASFDDGFDDDLNVEQKQEDSVLSGLEDAVTLDENYDPGVMIFNGKKYAVGLFWLVTDELAGSSLAKKRAKSAKADFFCMRDSVISQHGFGRLSQGHKMGMPSAGAETADMMVGEWHAMFRADNGWWYLAVHGDAIAPNGDRFFESEEEAYNYFMEQTAAYKWPRIYAPADWDVPNVTAELFLERILDQGPATNLKPVTLDALFVGRRNKVIAGFGFLILFGIIFLVSLLPNLILSNLQEPPPIMSVAEMNLGEVKAPPKPKQVEKVVEGITKVELPRPSTVIAACGESISRIVRPLPGWEIVTANCDGNRATVRWRENGGSLSLLLKNTGIFPKGSIARFESGLFIVSVPVPDKSQFMDETTPLENREAQLVINNRLGGAGSLTMRYVQPPAPQPETGISIREQEPPKAPPAFLDVKFSTETSPQTIASYFDVPGLDLQSMEWNFQSATWTYQAKVNLEQG